MTEQRTSISYILAERPGDGDIIPGKTFEKRRGPAPTEQDLKDGQIFIEALCFSLDPAMRVWLNERESYTTPVALGDVMRGSLLARVLASKSSKVKAGDIVNARTGWQEIAIANEDQFSPPPELPSCAKLTDRLGLFGLTGLTAYFGITKIGRVKKGDTVLVSGAAGATGGVVGQIARILGAARVIGTAGTEEKCKWLTDVAGFDVALNYRDADFDKKFEEATPDLIDVYFDNVGGHILDLALGRAALNSRFVECGMIEGYNREQGQYLSNLAQIIFKRITIQGFIFTDHINDVPAAQKQLGQWLSEGKIKTSEHIVKGSMEDLDEVIQMLFNGKNTGKLLLEVKSLEG